MSDSTDKQPAPISTKQFVWASAFITAGFALWLVPDLNLLPEGIGLFSIAMVIGMSRKERNEPAPPRNILMIFAGLALLVALCFVGRPSKPPGWEITLEHHMHSPLVVLPLWALMEYAYIRRWCSFKSAIGNRPS